MRLGLVVLIVSVISLLALARSWADTPTMQTIAIHPEVATILQLPDEIVDAWLDHHGDIRVARKSHEVAVRPRAGARPGDEATLEPSSWSSTYSKWVVSGIDQRLI